MVKNGQLFLGEYEPNLTKGFRVALPKRIRDVLLKEKEVILSKGFEGCIFGYSKSFFELESEKTLISNVADKHSRFLKRFLFGSAFEVEFDSQGRIILPRVLVQNAELIDETSVTLIGAGDHFEIWNRKNWELMNKELTKELL